MTSTSKTGDLVDNELADPHADLGEALDQLAALRDKLDTALVAAESAHAAKHAANNRSQRLLGVAESAVRELIAAGAGDAAARVQELIRTAMDVRS